MSLVAGKGLYLIEVQVDGSDWSEFSTRAGVDAVSRTLLSGGANDGFDRTDTEINWIGDDQINPMFSTILRMQTEPHSNLLSQNLRRRVNRKRAARLTRYRLNLLRLQASTDRRILYLSRGCEQTPAGPIGSLSRMVRLLAKITGLEHDN